MSEKDDKQIIRDYYNTNPFREWERLLRHPSEFYVTTRMMDRYIQPGQKVLDIGGGPGRYALYYAKRGCEVTLVDLSEANVQFALRKAQEEGIQLTAFQGDALEISNLVDTQFDHVLNMGPLYHILEEEGRVRCVEESLKVLKPGGNFYAAFLLMFSGMIYMLSLAPSLIVNEEETPFLNAVLNKKSYGGDAFTRAYFIDQDEILPFMQPFGLEQLHFFGQEGILSPFSGIVNMQPKYIREQWLDITYQLIERPEFLSYSQHAMYIGRKR